MKVALLALALLTASSVAMAQTKAKKKSSGSGASSKVGERADEVAEDLESYNVGSYGMAGCGLGSIVIKENSGIQVFAATTNGTLYSQSFGIISGTSKCTGRAKKVAIEQRVFIESNFAQLSVEAARGDGEHLRAFAELLGCDEAEFSAFSRSNHEEIFVSPASDQVLKAYKNGFGDRCKRLG